MQQDLEKTPTQLDICFSEKCNLNCDYCFVNKTSTDILDFETISSAVNTFFALAGENKTITFTTSESFLYPILFKKSVKYIYNEAARRKINVQVVATTNGVLFDEKMRKFVSMLDEDKFTLNFSLDGKARSHDAHRKVRGDSAQSSFNKAIANFNAYDKKHLVRIITTITPSEVAFLEENMEFILSQGFNSVDLFPQMFAIWNQQEQILLKENLSRIITNLNGGKWQGKNLRLLNRLWGTSPYAKILLGSDGAFYLFEWILPLKYEDRAIYKIGDLNNLNMDKRGAMFDFLFEKARQKNGEKCCSCKFNKFCANPLPLYLWATHNRMDFHLYFKNFCQLSHIMINSSGLLENKNILDKIEWSKSLGI